MSRPRIFVHIPAYRDRECQWTLRDMFERARHPDRVFAGVCWQTVPEEDADCFQIRPHPAQVRTADFHAREARGLGWARAKAQALWQGEEFSLQIDSHMRFADDWDEAMLDMLAACDAPEPVLTVYPPGYQPPDMREDIARPFVQTVRRFLPNGLLDFNIQTLPDDFVPDRPMPTAAVAGGFIFGPARILRDVPSDPDIYFTGEEPNLAVRLWTAGFDLFSPHRTAIYHYYLRKDSSRHWNDAASRDMLDLQARTMHRMRLLCEPGAFAPEQVAELGRYGLGTRRSLAEYEAYAGVNFAARTIAVEARRYPFVRPPALRDALPLPDTLRPTPETQLFILGDDGVLFDEAKGTLHRLNHAAARNWCALEAGWTWQRLAADAAAARGISPDAAMAELRELAAHWIGEGLLHDSAEVAPFAPRLDSAQFAFRDRCYRLLDAVVRIRFGDAALEALVHPAFAHLETPDASVAIPMMTVVRIHDWHYIFAGDQMVLLADTPRKLVPKLKAELMARAIARHDHVLHLHAAAVTHAGRLVLFPAASGSGKSVLTAQLLARGCGYFSDDAVLLRRDGTMRPIPVALTMKTGAPEILAAQFPDLAALPEHDREDGAIVRYLPPPPASLLPPGHAARPDLLIFPRFVPGSPTRLSPITPVDALERLLAECLAIPHRLDAEAVATVVDAVEHATCWDLVTGDPETPGERVIDAVNARINPGSAPSSG